MTGRMVSFRFDEGTLVLKGFALPDVETKVSQTGSYVLAIYSCIFVSL